MENIFYILIPAQRRVCLSLSLTWQDVPHPVVSIIQSKIPGSSDHLQQWCQKSNDLHSFTTMKKALLVIWNLQEQASLKDVPWTIHDTNTTEKWRTDTTLSSAIYLTLVSHPATKGGGYSGAYDVTQGCFNMWSLYMYIRDKREDPPPRDHYHWCCYSSDFLF